MTIQQNGGFKSSGEGPKEVRPPEPVSFIVKFTYWPSMTKDCSPSDSKIIVQAMSYDEAVENSKKELKAKKMWRQVIAIHSVSFVCDGWGRAIKPTSSNRGKLQFEESVAEYLL
jgi:hypothetical protein